jgi:hypothetical protein
MDVIKFICKEMWQETFRKQADKLQTNHKGIYVLHDNHFRWLHRVSSATTLPEEGVVFTHFPCGLIRGVLNGCGIRATVRADIPTLPKCTSDVGYFELITT